MAEIKKIRVLECIRQGQIGGGESHLLSLCENMDRQQFEPVVLSFTDGPMIERLKEMGIENNVIYTERPFDISKWGKVKRFLKQQQIDIVHAHGTRANSNILWAARVLGIPVIYTIHGWSFHQDQHPVVKRLRVFSEKLLTAKSDINISVSVSNQQSGKSLIKPFRSVVINNGIDQNKFNPQKEYKNIREELGIPENKVLVLFIARFTAHKQPLTLIEAFKKALVQNPQLHLLMGGDGDQKREAVTLIRQWDLEKQVTLQPFRHDVPDVLAAADVFVLPSLWEGLPIGLLEAMAMGKAVIASNVDGTSEIVENNVNGLLVDTVDLAENLCKAIIHLSLDAEKREQFQQKAMETVKEKYNAKDMTRQIENIYLQLSKN